MNARTAKGVHVMERAPITKQRSPWVEMDGAVVPVAGATWWVRSVHDGQLRACVAEEPIRWHLSISHVDNKSRPRRYPTWDEIADARDLLLPDDVAFVMHLPVAGEYVAVHATTFHLHEHPERAA
jgi:hypothetical protein